MPPAIYGVGVLSGNAGRSGAACTLDPHSGPKSADALESIASKSNLDAAGRSTAFVRLQSLTLRAQPDLKPIAAMSHPVLIYYPGGTSHRLSNGAVCEALASAGYIVFTLDAPCDAPIVVFPDGRMVPLGEIPAGSNAGRI